MNNLYYYLRKSKYLRRLKRILSSLTPKRIRFHFNLVKVRIFDRIHGTDFGGRLYHDEIGTTRERANDYSPSPADLVKTLKKLRITDKDAIVDMGSGKGYAMYKMSKFPFAVVGGVELSKSLCEKADENMKKVMPPGKVWHVYNCDVGTWEDYDMYNIFYIYNSFPKQVIKEVNLKICESIQKNPRKVTLLYLFPEFPEEFLNDSRWKLIEKGSVSQIRYGMHIFENVI